MIIVKKNKEIAIQDIKITDRAYHGKNFKTLFINNEYYVTRRDKIKYICSSCKKEVTEFYCNNIKFHREQIFCRNCSNIKTSMSRYGVKNSGWSKESQQKIRETMLEKYNATSAFKSEIIKEKIKQTNKKNFGYENSFQSPKSKETLMKNYGVRYPSQNFEICQKTFRKLLTKFPLRDYHSIKYQSNKELEFLKLCEKNSISVKNGPSIEYSFKNKIHVYHVDFESKDFLIEIKDKHYWYYQDLKSGKLESKNLAAQEFAIKNNKIFKFILENNDLIDLVESLKKEN